MKEQIDKLMTLLGVEPIPADENDSLLAKLDKIVEQAEGKTMQLSVPFHGGNLYVQGFQWGAIDVNYVPKGKDPEDYECGVFLSVNEAGITVWGMSPNEIEANETDKVLPMLPCRKDSEKKIVRTMFTDGDGERIHEFPKGSVETSDNDNE